MLATHRVMRCMGRAAVQMRHKTSSQGNDGKDAPKTTRKIIQSDGRELEIPCPPVNCCMSGCANCVWIEYAEELATKLRDGSSMAREIIMKEVEDPNMRSFLEMELRVLNQKTKK